LLASTLVACASADEGTTQAVAIQFAPLVAGAKFNCAQEYSGVGSGKTSFKPLDFRMFVTEVVLIRDDGKEVPVALTNDGEWQRGNYALLDFEDGAGTCVGGTKATNYVVRGTIPKGSYSGVAFTIGIPDADNHLDAATAPSPLNAPGMWWSWSGGYKYIRLDVQTPKNKGYFLHLGATKCTGSVATSYTCAAGNQPRVKLDKFDATSGQIAFDVAELWSDVDLDAQIDGKSDFVPGCMAFDGDPECPAVFNKLGLNMDGSRLPISRAFKGVAK
jgi:uncharacterized repeat protein (TIGR04052 family)